MLQVATEMLQASTDVSALLSQLMSGQVLGSVAGTRFLMQYAVAADGVDTKLQVARALLADCHQLLFCPLDRADCQKLFTLLACLPLEFCSDLLHELFSALPNQVSLC